MDWSMRTRLASRLTLLAVIVATIGPALAGEVAKPRYTLDSSQSGFVRLDTKTGTVTHCSLSAGKWTCDTLLSGDAQLSGRLDALALEVARLTAATAALDRKVSHLSSGTAGPSTALPAPAPATSMVLSAPPAAQPGVTERIVKRLLAMVRLLKHGRGPAKAAVTPS
jgi:hypothetical protein